MAKNSPTIILSIICAIFFITSINSCNGSLRQKRARDKEMAARLDAEEKLVKFSQERQEFDDRLKAKEDELAAERAAHQATKKALLQEQLVNNSLKEELAKHNRSGAVGNTARSADRSDTRKR